MLRARINFCGLRTKTATFSFIFTRQFTLLTARFMQWITYLPQFYSTHLFAISFPCLSRILLYFVLLFILSKASPSKGQNKGNETITWCLLFHSSAPLLHKQQNPWLITAHSWLPGHSWSFPYGLFEAGTHTYIKYKLCKEMRSYSGTKS